MQVVCVHFEITDDHCTAVFPILLPQAPEPLSHIMILFPCSRIFDPEDAF